MIQYTKLQDNKDFEIIQGVNEYRYNCRPKNPLLFLFSAWINAKRGFEREHTTPYIWENTAKFRIGNVFWETGLDYSMTHRFTVDYKEDYNFIKQVYDELYEVKNNFGLNDILDLLERKPELKKINRMYAGVNWYRNHINELKTISPEQTKNI